MKNTKEQQAVEAFVEAVRHLDECLKAGTLTEDQHRQMMRSFTPAASSG